MRAHRIPLLRIATLLCAVSAVSSGVLAVHTGRAAAQPDRRSHGRAAAESARPVFAARASDPRVVAEFSFTAGQTPEAIAVQPDGSADVSLARASTAVRVAADGHVEPLGQVPRSGSCPPLGILFSAGIARSHEGAIYLASCTGNADTGLWRLDPGSTPTQIARLPEGSVPHGMALDEHGDELYVADSLLGVVWRVPASGGTPKIWATGAALQRTSLFGANGVAVHDHAVWVSNTDQGTIVEIPIRRDGTPGRIRTVVTGLSLVGSFTVLGRDDTIIAAMTVANQVVVVQPGGRPQLLLSAADGLSNPTAVAVRNDTLYVCDGAYFTHTDPNLLVARLDRPDAVTG